MPRTVLFIDDDSLMLMAIRRALRELDAEKYFAGTPQEAMQILEAHRIDVVFSDLMMPGIDGEDLMLRIKSAYPETVRVIVSGMKPDYAMIDEGVVHHVLEKPIDYVRVKAIIAEPDSETGSESIMR